MKKVELQCPVLWLCVLDQMEELRSMLRNHHELLAKVHQQYSSRRGIGEELDHLCAANESSPNRHRQGETTQYFSPARVLYTTFIPIWAPSFYRMQNVIEPTCTVYVQSILRTAVVDDSLQA